MYVTSALAGTPVEFSFDFHADYTRVAFSAPYLDIQLALVTRRDSPPRSIDDLKGRHVGVRVATTAADYVWKQAHARRITLYDMNEKLCGGCLG